MSIDYFNMLSDDETVVAVVKGVGFDYCVADTGFGDRYGVYSHDAEDTEFEFEFDLLHVYRSLGEALAAIADIIKHDLDAELANPLAGS
jgi:hypothetical protein